MQRKLWSAIVFINCMLDLYNRDQMANNTVVDYVLSKFSTNDTFLVWQVKPFGTNIALLFLTPNDFTWQR
jgi:hypothetical protein